MKLNTYLNLCTQAYDLSKPTPPQDAYDFYRSYADEMKGKILEPMCGTGRFLLPLVADRYDVDGFDGSQYMLDALHVKAKDRQLKVNVWQGMIEEIKTTQKYNFIFIPSGSFGLITDLNEAKIALKKFYDLLDDNGLLVFEVETSQSVPTPIGIWRGTSWEKEGGNIIGNFLALPVENNILTVICRYELIDKNIITQTEIEYVKVRLYDDTSYLMSLLKEIGFSEVQLIKAFDRNKQPENNDEVIVYECKK